MKKSLPMLALAVLFLGAGTARAQSPVLGQPYQVPPGYESYVAGSVVAYGGYNYVIQGDGTMLLADQPDGSAATCDGSQCGQVYQIPNGFAGYPAGTVITYGGCNYVIQADGTMLLADQPDYTAGSCDDDDSGQSFQIPAGYGDYPVGSEIAYGDRFYRIGLNGTMMLLNGNYHGKHNTVNRYPKGTTRSVHPWHPYKPVDHRTQPHRDWGRNYIRPPHGPTSIRPYRPHINNAVMRNPGGINRGPRVGPSISRDRVGGGVRQSVSGPRGGGSGMHTGRRR
jgi:hypothetical protein